MAEGDAAEPAKDGGGADGAANEGGDDGEKKDEKAGLFDRFFGGSKKKEDPEEKKKKADMEKQEKEKLEEARKKKEELERKKIERREQEETQRMAAKRERYQQLLQKNPDPTRRVFQFYMKAIKLDYLQSDPINGLFFKVTLGGDYQEREEPGKGLVRKGKKGQQFQTAKAGRLTESDTHYFRNDFGAGIPVYWMGSYVDLEIQEFQIELWQSYSLKKSKRRSQTAITLSQLAQGSVMLEFMMQDEKASGDAASKPFVRVSFVCYFQELFVFQLRFVAWRGFNLLPADAPKRKERAKLEENRERRRREQEQEKAERRRKAMDERKALRERRRQARIEAQRLAITGGKLGQKDGGTGGGVTSSTGGTGSGGDTGEGGMEMGTTGGGAPAAAESDRLGLLGADSAAQLAGGDVGGPQKATGMKGLLSGLRNGRKRDKGAKGPPVNIRATGRLSFEERVELQNQKDQRAKERKDANELKRLKKLKEFQDRRDAAREAKAKAAEEKDAKANPDDYEEASSDPYIVFSIDPPTNPGCKVLRNGGYFGRMVRTDMVTNTLNPSFEEARKPLAYLGTRSELENEMLRIRVYDWDFFSADDLIGQADVPLNGLLEYGQVEVELTLDVPDLMKKKIRGKHPKKTIPAGRLTGQILFEGRLPEYNQLGGGIIERKPNVTYLAVRLNSASKLTAADPNGSSDPFVTVDWDGAQQTSKVLTRTLEPVWKQTLYFPLKLVTINKDALALKPPVSIRVFDMDEAGHDLLGSCEIPLHKITAAEHAKMDDEVGADGRIHKGRVLNLPSQPLLLPGHKIQSTINLQLYFAPDLPLDILLDEEAERRAQSLSDEYMARLKAFWPSLPGRIRKRLEDELRAELGRGSDYDLGFEHFKRVVSAEDQDATEHFLCEYLCPQQPPKEMETPMQIARMVRCITWAQDTEIFKKDQRRDVWQSPTFFLEMRKGDCEDHALLMCNLLLGQGRDAYVCVGRLHDASEGDKRHVWVMTREEDGSVLMWETSQGSFVELPARWPGIQISEEEKAENRLATAAATKSKATGSDADDAAAAASRKSKGRLVGGLARRLSRGKGNDKAIEAVDALVLGAADAVQKATDGAVQKATDAAGVVALKGASMIAAIGVDTEADGPSESTKLLVNRDADLLDVAHGLIQDEGEELLTRADIEESLTEIMWEGVVGAGSGSGDALGAVGARMEKKEEDSMLLELRRGADAELEFTDEQLASAVGPLPPCPPLLYSAVEVVFNHKNLFVSNTVLDPSRIRYDLDDKSLWTCFLEPRQIASGMPKPFYSPKRLGAKVAAERLRSMEAQIEGELKQQIKLARSSGLTTTINKSPELVETLKRGLEMHERSAAGDVEARNELQTWEKRDVRTRLPAGATFRARPFHFAYTDAKKIRKTLLSAVPYTDETGDGTEFAVAVKVFAFHGGICSVWVFFGMIKPNVGAT